MWRVLNVPKALSTLKPQTSGSFTIEVVDEHFTENQGPWWVEYSPEGVSVVPASKAGLVMDIRQFSQAFMGQPGLMDLALNGLIEVRSDADLLGASGLLSAQPVCCLDAF
jgi:predicted acetyltransferase